MSGFVRIVAVGAILGPTYLANVYQFGSTLPNLIFTFLTGSLFVSILVPVVVPYLDRGEIFRANEIVGQFLGLACLVFGFFTIALILGAPIIVGLLLPSHGSPPVLALLVALLVPQTICYAVIGCCSAVQNASGRVIFPAASPLIENTLTIATLAIFALLRSVEPPLPSNEIGLGQVLVLGIGSTVAVMVHAVCHLSRTRSLGFAIRPRIPRLSPELRGIYAITGPSMLGAAAQASRTLFLSFISSAIPGGVVALQLALNFYSIVEALVARPLGQVALPELSRTVIITGRRRFGSVVVRLVARCLRICVPIGVALVVFAPLLAQVVSVGRMSGSHGVELVSEAILGIAPGASIQCVVFLITTALYASRQVATTVLASVVRAIVAIGLGEGLILFASRSLLELGAIFSFTDLIALLILTRGSWKWFWTRLRWFVIHGSITVGSAVLAGFMMWLLDRALADVMMPALIELFIVSTIGLACYVALLSLGTKGYGKAARRHRIGDASPAGSL